MDIARFHYAVDSIVNDLQSTRANEHLASLINALSTVSSQPGQPNIIDQYKNQLEVTRQALQESELNNPKMELSDFIEQFKLQQFIGDGLFKSILREISENQIAPHAALEALQQLQAKLLKKISDLEAINNSFTTLGVPYEGEFEGDSEIEIKIPAAQETKTLNDLATEAKEWHRDISTISEVFDPDRSTTTIRTLATGSWQFYLASVPLVLFGVAKCIRGVNEILQELMRTKDLLNQLIKTKAPKKVIKDYEEHLKTSTSDNLSTLASSLVDEHYKGGDEGRKAELKNALTQSLKRLSKKLSEGSKVSLRIANPAKPKIANPDNLTPEEIAAIESVKKTEEIRAAMLVELEKIELLEHDPEISKSLPAPDNDPE